MGVHIADVSHFVRPKTALDREALERATSVYLPDRVLPMLPEVISNGLASLQPGKVRYTKSADDGVHRRRAAGFDRAVFGGHPQHASGLPTNRSTSSCAESAQRLRTSQSCGGKVCDLLGRMHDAGHDAAGKRRLANGALELNMPEVKVELDKQGRVTGAHVVENTESHQIIEEFMLAANEAVAETLRDRGLHFLRRVHQSPSPQKLER